MYSVEAALAADLTTAVNLCIMWGGGARSQLDHGLEGLCILHGGVALSADLITALKLCIALGGGANSRLDNCFEDHSMKLQRCSGFGRFDPAAVHISMNICDSCVCAKPGK